MTEHLQRVQNILDRDFDSYLEDLSALVRIPSVSWSAFDPLHVERSAQAVAALATDLEFFDSVNIVRAPKDDGTGLGQPAVLARKEPRNGAKTVLLYAHHDVQPPGDDALWETSVFEPVIRGDRMFGRGAADDKAGVVSHLASIKILQELGATDLGVVLFIEGEEEFGSPSFSNFLRDNKETLASDVIIVADSGNWSTTVPALTVSLRGNVTMTVRVRTLDHAVHSGMFGGPVPDAFMVASRIMTSFYASDGTVCVSGLTGSDEKTPEYPETQLREESGLLPSVDAIGSNSYLSRIWTQPSITITGIDAPTIENASNTLLPEVAFKISVRVAPGQKAQEAADAVIAHIDSVCPFGVIPIIEDVTIGEGFLVNTAGDAVAGMKKAMSDAWGETPVDMGVGGSIPFISEFVSEFSAAEILVTGVEDPDSRAHSPNESLHLGVFRKAIAAQAIFLSALSNKE